MTRREKINLNTRLSIWGYTKFCSLISRSEICEAGEGCDNVIGDDDLDLIIMITTITT